MNNCGVQQVYRYDFQYPEDKMWLMPEKAITRVWRKVDDPPQTPRKVVYHACLIGYLAMEENPNCLSDLFEPAL